MLQRMSAELVFSNMDEARPIIATLIELGFSCELLDWIDDYSPAVFYLVEITTDLDEDAFFNWVQATVDTPDGGMVLEAGLSNVEPAQEMRKARRH